MTELTPAQKLDLVLRALKTETKNVEPLYQYLYKNEGINIDFEELRRIARKLEKDGYINIVTTIGYVITFDGILFIDAGGYETKILAENAAAEKQQLEIDRLKSFDVSNDQNQKTLNKLTHRLSVATWFAGAAAALLLVWQIVQYFLDHNFVWQK
ncbi:MAG TPA: hypothetical protein VG367_13070 [Mucilaginibacter sp.]|nr:hypothetical protein [Mucilaginibacter sp.]